MNGATLFILSILIFIVILIIRSIMNDKRNGKSSCGGNCSGCGSSSLCHNSKTLFEEYKKEKNH